MDEKLIIGIVSGQLHKELEFKYDTDLREKRIPQYLELWKLLEDLAPKWATCKPRRQKRLPWRLPTRLWRKSGVC